MPRAPHFEWLEANRYVIGQTLSHFKITAKLGEGGMGEVYRATDTKLGREVALKVLPAEMAASAERLERFRREAMTLASLDHPGIVHVYSIEESDGQHFLTMQLIEGESLDLLIPEGGLAVDRILEIARALAEALAAAHDKGIVHRDLKPTNVMVTGDGRVKVLDFGLAKFTGPQSGEVLDSTLQTELRTSDGVVMGTVPYMSPEQLSGLQIDHRSDLFSLGVILYEMASGERPFQGRSSIELASAILRDTSRPLDERRADLPPDLGRVIERCLEKNAEDRFPSARDLGEALNSVTAEVPLSQAAAAPASRPASEVPSGAVRQDEGFWVAVLPFKCSGSDADLAALAEALPEEIATGLSRFSYLRVVAHGSTAGSVRDSAEARYVMEGSLRHAGTKLRLAVQLVDATTGAHLWAENYERSFSPEAIFELQDDLVPRIVSTVADMNGVLPRSMGEALRSRSADQLSPYEAVLRSFAYFQRVTAEELAAARSALEVAVQEAPAYTDAWAMLALLCAQEYGQGFNLLPDPLATGAAAARRAVEEGPTNPLAHFSLAQVLFFQKEFQTFRNAAERASSLNPMDGNSIAFLGELLTYSGDSERGLELAGRAKQLNPHHPGWYWFADFYHWYSQRDYPAALDVALRVNLPGHWGEHCATAAAAGQVGDRETAEKALRKLLELRPDIADIAHQEFRKWWNPEFEELMIDGLRKAGLESPSASESESPSTAADAPPTPSSGATRADEGFWVAVLPFKSTGTSTDLEALAEGLSEEIVAGLARFSYLRVIGHGSTQRYAGKSSDMRTVGQELGARYVMNGSLRQAGSRLRTAVQLIDASTGAQLWAETYERPFSAEAVFELQDDLVPRIVSTVADIHGVLPHSMSEAVRLKSVDEISPYEALLRSFGYNERFTPEDFAEVTACLERAVQQAPGNADLWAMLSLMYANEYGHWGNPGEDCLPRALEAARKAVEVAPLSSLPYYALAQALFFHRDIPAFRIAAERSVELNPMDGATAAWMGLLIAYAGDWERGCTLSENGLRLNPNHPGMYRYAAWHDAYRKKDYAKALDIALQLNAPKNFYTPAVLAMCYAQLGQMEPARKALRDLLELKPDYAEVAQELHGRWIQPDLVEHLMQGLRKAGLDVPPAPGTSQTAAETDAVAIAVMPFSDMSPAGDQEYLCEGMAEEIMNALVRIDGIRVASRTSAFRARQDSHDLPSIASALSVGHVLEGSVRTAGSRLRVTAQLTDVASGYQLWSERFDRETDDIFAVQDEIAAGVVEAVKAHLAPGALRIQARPKARNLEAYRWYLKGRHLRSKEDHEGAQRAFEEAVRLDPSYAPAWTALAEITVLAVHFSLVPAREGCAAARQALATAAELQGESAEGLHCEAFVAFIERRWADMEAKWRRALELQPTHILSLGAFGLMLCTRQRLDEGLPFLERVLEADPLASFPYARSAVGFLVNGRPEEALRYAQDGLTFEKEDITAVLASSMAKIALGRFEEGITEAEQMVELSRRGAVFLGLLGWALATAGRNGEARALLEELRARPADSPTIVSEAWLLGALGEIDEAFEVVDLAEEEYQAFLYYTGLPGFDPLRADPRFAALLTRLELPPA